jgi:hypothetical protein
MLARGLVTRLWSRSPYQPLILNKRCGFKQVGLGTAKLGPARRGDEAFFICVEEAAPFQFVAHGVGQNLLHRLGVEAGRLFHAVSKPAICLQIFAAED